VTLNADDSIASDAAEDVDPFMEYVLLGDSLSDGVLAWTSIGVNVSEAYNVSAAATIYANGGVANSNAMSGGPGGNMTMGENGTINGTMNATLTARDSGAVVRGSRASWASLCAVLVAAFFFGM
jgi:hypothetical protein